MKKILIALALVLAVHAADAQVKTPEVAKKALDGAVAASQDAKKATKVATWLKLATAYMDAYNAPAGAIWLGASKQELQLIMANEKPVKVEQVSLGGEPCTKEVYKNKELYFNKNGQLAMINITKPVVEDALEGARNAYAKAYEVDLKKSKLKDVLAGLENVAKKYLDEGMNMYMLDDFAGASVYFEKSANAAATEPLAKVDTTALYNAGFTAWMVKDYPRAKKFFNDCLEAGYYYENGEVFAKLADIYTNLEDKTAARDVLEAGFTKFPQSQSILIGLINYYLESGENTNRLFELIGEAKKNEPENVSLYYVEGNIHKQLGDFDSALAAYQAALTVDPNYDFGYHGQGALLYDKAVQLSEKAQAELDDAKYNALVKEYEQVLLDAIAPFEKAFEVTSNPQVKLNAAEYLKNIYYRFSSVEDKYMEGYKKYNEYVKANF